MSEILMNELPPINAIGDQIAAYVIDPEQTIRRAISWYRGTRFVVCGPPGSGKTAVIDWANHLVPEGEQIAESDLLLKESDPAKGLRVFEDPTVEYEAYLNIGFAVYSRSLATALESNGVKVFWLK